MSEPCHFNEVRICGRVETFYRRPGGQIAGVMLAVSVEEDALIPVLSEAMPRVSKGQCLFVRGTLATMPEPGQRYPLLCVLARSIERLKPRPPQER